MANDDLKLVTNGKFSLQATSDNNVFYFYRNDGEPIGNGNSTYLGNNIDILYKTYINHKYDNPFDINKRIKITTKESADSRMIIVTVYIIDQQLRRIDMEAKRYFSATDGEFTLSETGESTIFYDVLALSRNDQKRIIDMSDEELRIITSKLYYALKETKNEKFEHVNISSYNSLCGTVIKVVATKMCS